MSESPAYLREMPPPSPKNIKRVQALQR